MSDFFKLANLKHDLFDVRREYNITVEIICTVLEEWKVINKKEMKE